MRTFLFLLFIASLNLTACVGTDLIEETVVPERVRIITDVKKIDIGQSVQLSTQFYNQYGREEKPSISWRTSDATKVSVDATGLAKGLAKGRVVITATTGKITDSLVVNSDDITPVEQPPLSILERVGQFSRISQSYQIAGTARLKQANDGKLTLIFDSNFQVSAGPSLYVLLTNNTNGGYTVTAGGNAQNGTSVQITPNKLSKFSGEMTYNVPAGVRLSDYKFAVLYCTLGPVFGAAELK